VAAQHPKVSCQTGAGSGGGVVVDLDEWSVSPRPQDAAHGRVTLRARNRGRRTHELAIARVPTPSALPLGDDQTVAEDRLAKGDFIGEIEPFAPGQTCTTTFTLGPGTYAMYCNLLEQAPGEPVNHFAKGMVTVFNVR
jgi:hypothetical protein